MENFMVRDGTLTIGVKGRPTINSDSQQLNLNQRMYYSTGLIF